MGYEIEEVEERVILVGVADGVMKETEDSYRNGRQSIRAPISERERFRN